jgi:hypothetical protein
MTSSLSKRLKMRRKPLSRRNSRSISLRRLYQALLYRHGSTLVHSGGTTCVILFLQRHEFARQILVR